MQGFGLELNGVSAVEFATDDERGDGSEREPFSMENGLVSLRELAEEELLLALPVIAACTTPKPCGPPVTEP